MIGTKLAHYEITSHLGTGGMGEVYQATDSKLGRGVAIKLLPEVFSHDVERVARFEREARVLASLNHPNIAAIYGVEDSGGRKFLVMELVPGETLEDRLKDGAIPLEEALTLARQMAVALEAAHEQGIVHRDLKPANVKITPHGKLKVLDFGLAKAFEIESANASLSNSPTLSIAATQAGLILGTAAYMAPEQARGKTVDKRADIWAFGAIFHEMLTGDRLFKGDDVSEILAAVIKEQPHYEAVPHEVRRLIQKCLEKDPARRLRDIGDVWELLDSDARISIDKAPSRGWFPWAWVAAAMLALSAAAAVLAVWAPWRTSAPSPRLARLEVTLPPLRSPQLEMSPDGRILSFVGRTPKNEQAVWIRSLDSTETRMLAGTENFNGSWFWSYDSRFIAFMQGSTLRKIDVSSGVVSTVASHLARSGAGGSWNKDGVVLVGGGSGVQRVSLTDGAVTLLTKAVPAQDLDHIFPRLLPDGRHFVYVRQSGERQTAVLMIGSLDLPPEKQPSQPLTTTQAGGADDRVYFIPASSTGPARLLFHRDNTVLAQTFDADSLTLSGEPVPLSEGRVSFFSAAPGVLVYHSGDRAANQLVLYDRGGKEITRVGPVAAQYNLRVSSDGARIAVERQTPNRNVWGLEFGREAATKLTTDLQSASSAVWSPDGSQFVFTSRAAGGLDLHRRASNGTGAEQLLLTGVYAYPSDWSPDGRFILYTVTQASSIALKTGPDIYVLPLEKGTAGKPRPYLNTAASETQAVFSRDGNWVAYSSNESGTNQVYVSSFPDPKARISIGAGNQPRWGREGMELFYFDPDDTLMSVTIRIAGGAPKADNPKQILKVPVVRSAGTDTWGTGWDTVPGGRFLINVTAAQSDQLQINVVLNWESGLK